MSTLITPSQLKDSYFGDVPDFPSITSAMGSGVNHLAAARANGSVDPTYISPLPNSIYHNRRVHTASRKSIDANTYSEITARVWQIPFTADPSIPLKEITQRINTAMDKLGLYTCWQICYNDHMTDDFFWGHMITATEHIKAPLK